jgi:hypothetical protein
MRPSYEHRRDFLRYPGTMRQALEARFACAVAAAGPAPRDASWPPLRLPPALRESLVGAARRDACPDAVVAHYCERMPALLVEQLRPEDGPRALLGRPLDRARLPRFGAALDGLFAALDGAGIDARALTGAATPDALLAARPTAAALYAHTLFGSGLPLLGVYPADRPALAAALATRDADEVLDLCLSSHLVHELCHGPGREYDGPPAPWLVAEAAATHLGAAARAQHLFPDEPGEALRGVSLFVLVGEVLARRFGRAALWRVALGTPTAELFGARTARALDGAAWDDWRARQEAPFARDALGAFAWIKLIDAARSDDDATLAGASARAWRDLPWWSDAAGDEDRALVPRAVAALFQVNAMTPTFQTVPSEPPQARLLLDVAGCLIAAERRADGVFAEPASWLFPPPLARALAERGAERVRIEGATRARRATIAAALVELCDGSAPLPREVELSWASSR